ncbi:hypothetical protein LOTGIDRAFT_184623 [Lottia gigantea]|uniref:FIT family protein n=1 Tax=Lottia gigantea TaxID=225164 RepID=V3YXL6_LOTGI|nr:hypothetical protein LOTGIDRAFT_184623 [Lottia gigantea]ESO82823.1 hypothetical protein LOTGIDRAFT_184623 [Lottia gigantea]
MKNRGKKPIAEPIHIGHFIMIVIMKLCRTVLLIDTSVKIGLYLMVVLIGSVICDLHAMPRGFFSDKKNFLNVYFIKLGWGWTLSLIGPFIFMTSFVYCCGNLNQVRRHVMRLAVGTVWWYVCTSFFVYVNKNVGVCTLSNLKDSKSCLEAGKSWLGFDISGHVFLMIHSLLIISEEMKCFKDWTKLKLSLDDENLTQRKNLSASEISQAKTSHKQLTPLIQINVVFITLLSLLFEFMLLITIIYRFHTLSQKVFAAFIAVGFWFVDYRMLFRTKIDIMPCLPGECTLNYYKYDI